MALDLLTLEELEAIGARVDFHSMRAPVATSMAALPIDFALREVALYFQQARELARGAHAIATLELAIPGRAAPGWPEPKQGPLPPMHLRMIGARIHGFAVLSIEDAIAVAERPEIWCLLSGDSRLVHSRCMPMMAAEAFDGADPRESLARLEAAKIGEAACQGAPGAPTLRI